MTVQSQRIADQFAVPELFTVGFRHIWLVIGIGLLSAVVAFAIGRMVPPTFEATTQLYVDPRDLNALANQVTPTAQAQNIGVTLVETQALVLGSYNMLDKVVTKLDLTSDPEFNGAPRSFVGRVIAWVKGLGSASSDGDNDPKAVAIEALRKNVDVYRVDRSYVINATARAESRQKARSILEVLVQSFLDEQSQARSDAAQRTSKDIGSGIELLKKDLESWEQKVASYKVKNNLVGVRGQIVNEQQLSDLNTQLITAQVNAARLKARLDATPSRAGSLDQVPEAVASPTLRALRDLLARISQRKASLATQLKSRHPDLRSISDSERQVKQQIAGELRRIRQSLKIDYERAQANSTALKGQLEKLRTLLNTDNKAQIGLRELERKLEAARAIYGQAITRSKEAGQEARLNTANVRVISGVRADRNKVFPPPLALLALAGLLFGCLLTVLVLHLRGLFRQRAAA